MPAAPLIRVLNPSATPAITAGLPAVLAPYARASDLRFDCVTLAGGPSVIGSDGDVAQAAPLVAERVASDTEAQAFLIACYSDPGLTEARMRCGKPVIGFGAAAISTALALGERFGILSMSGWSVGRHARDMAARGVGARCAGDRPLGLTPTQAASGEGFERITQVARELRDSDGADVLILGCAGLSEQMQRLEAATGLPVVDPVRAAGAIVAGLFAGRSTGHD